MEEKNKKKGFLSKIIDKIDRKLEEKSRTECNCECDLKKAKRCCDR